MLTRLLNSLHLLLNGGITRRLAERRCLHEHAIMVDRGLWYSRAAMCSARTRWATVKDGAIVERIDWVRTRFDR